MEEIDDKNTLKVKKDDFSGFVKNFKVEKVEQVVSDVNSRSLNGIKIPLIP